MSGSSLARRVASGLVLAPLVFYLVYLGSWPFLLFIEAMVILGSIEFLRMARNKGAEPHMELGVLAAAALAALLYEGHA
ncbi:MAG TPA: phosphatidate cytidylyltransferase, partial [Candidatus Eisenbacteria bacterium]